MSQWDIKCPHCDSIACRSALWDAYACLECLIWLEKGCGLPKSRECYVGCIDRPEYPNTETDEFE